jgi:hypothetical protein
MDFCWNAIESSVKEEIDNLQDNAIAWAMDELLPGGGGVYHRITELKKVSDHLVAVKYYTDNGRVENATFEVAIVITKIAREVEGAKLFGLIGAPAVYCLEAGFWYTQEMGKETAVAIKLLLLWVLGGINKPTSGG